MSLLLPRILIVDHFDSYTLNLLSLLHPHDTQPAQVSPSDRDELTRRIADRVIVLPHTHPLLTPAAFHELVRPHIDAIILSPGPGSPDKASDFGAAETLLRDESLNLPVFGVCLGHQGLAIAFGGQVIRAASVRHGLQSKLKISSPSAAEAIAPSILRGVPQDALVIRYNSLVVDPSTLPDCLQVTAWSYDRVSTAPPPRPGTTRKHSMPSLLSPQPLSSEHVAPLKHRDLASLSRSPSTVPFSSRDGSERLSEVGDMPLSEATSIDEIPEVEAAHAPEHTGSPTIMALQHKTLPFHGVQFHPESIESHWGHTIMTNYLDIVRQYWTRRSSHHDAQTATDARSRVEAWDRADLTLPTHLTLAGERCLASNSLMHTQSHTSTSIVDNPRFALLAKRSQALPSDSCVNMTRIFDQHFRHSSPAGAVWLDSARMKDPHSRYSFMAAPSFILSYKDGGGRIVASGDGTSSSEILLTGADKPTLWSFMNELQAQLRSTMDMQAADGVLDEDQQGTMFRTGFTGYWGYEMKNESLDLETRAPVGDHADAFDAEFLYCPRVLAFDHHLRQWIAFALVDRSLPTASLRGPLGQLNGALEALQANSKHWSRLALDEADATAWMQDTLAYVLALCSDEPSSTAVNAAPSAAAFRAAMPLLKPRMLAEDYMDQIESARELIAAGESYELCMTNQFQGRLQSLSSLPNTADTDHFDLYCKLRARNPAPYSAFIRLPSFATTDVQGSKPRQRGRAILSTSPERFMRITADGHVEMKPIKGTLARAGFGPGEQGMRAGGGATWEEEQIKKKWREAEDEARRAKLSADIKERAENLMIVDLIRADLFSFCHSDSVAVPKLMQVESYETVHQLVTTVTGQLKSSVGTTEAIRRCFPPGSMTGAPKRRSVQLLERLELNLADAQRDDELRARRGIYSGALGWLGCDGAADFSVVIRTLIADGDDVSIGAGGAITYLSDAKKEWQEVLDKVTALANIEA